MKTPIVSVVMATFNETPDQISQAIGSILGQTLTDFELLIIDDSTQKDTIAMIDSFSIDDRIEIIRAEKRIGFVPALNIGLHRAKGKYIARMDGDDISLSHRLAMQVQYMEEHPYVDVLGGALDIIDQQGRCISHRDYPDTYRKLRWFTLMRSPLAHPAVMMRRSIVQKGFLYDESYSKSEDLELWLRLMKNGFQINNLTTTILQFRVCGDLAQKRTQDHFRYNYKARKQNFSWKYPVWSIFSILISKIYIMLPTYIIRMAYRLENKQ